MVSDAGTGALTSNVVDNVIPPEVTLIFTGVSIATGVVVIGNGED